MLFREVIFEKPKVSVFTLLYPTRWLDGEYELARAARRFLDRKWKNSGSTTDKIAYFEQRDKYVDLAKDKRILWFNEIIKSKRADMHPLLKIAS